MKNRILVGILALILGALLVTLIRAAVGPTSGADGTYNLTSARIDRTGALVVSHRGGQYGEDASRQNTFAAADQGAGITPTTSISTTAMIVLYNPSGNNMRFRVQTTSAGYVSGTLSSGTVYHCCNISTAQAAPSGGTLLTNTCLDIGSGTTGTGVVRTGATVASGTRVLRPWFSDAPQLATSVLGFITAKDDISGEFVIEPGASYQVQAVQAGAGTSPLISLGVTWTEEPRP